MDPSQEALVRALHEYRHRHGWNQHQLCNVINGALNFGWTQPVVSKLERGQRLLTLTEGLMLMRYLDIPLEDVT